MFLCINVYAEKIEVEYKKCVDGDTAWFVMNNEDVKVRFIAINAPELEHKEKEAEFYSEEAKDYVCTKLERAVPNSDKELVLNKDESDDINWFTREELDHIDCFPDIKITMDYILQNIIK